MPTAPFLAIALALSQGPVSILPETPDCVAPGDHPVVRASIGPGVDVRTAKVYFRSEKYSKFYFVSMSADAGTFTSVLPRPSAETTRIIYYIEAVDTTFTSVVGPESVVEVRPDCGSPDEKVAEVASAPAEIVVGSVEAGVPALPPGFETAGIVGTIASTGVLTGLGGGSGIGTAAVVGGVAAASAGGVVVATSTGGGEEPTSPPGASDNPAPTPSAPSPPTSTPPPPPTVPTNPPPTNPPTTPPPTPTPTPPPPPPPAPSTVEACFVASFPGKSCNLKLDGGCSTGAVQSWDWVIDAPASLGGTTRLSGQTVNRNFPHCAGESILVSLTVSGASGGQSSTAQTLKLPVAFVERLLEPPPRCTITSLLTPAGSRGTIVFDAVRADPVEGALYSRHELPATTEHEVDAYLVAGQGEGLWTFDLSRCEAIASGSLAAVQGAPVALDGTRIAFHLTGESGETVRFRFRLSR